MTFTLDGVIPWGRTGGEYEAMFALTAADWGAPVLGCGDGPAAFNAEATARGARVVSCDPLYRFPGPAIAARIAATFPTVLAQLEANRDAYCWRELGSPAAAGRARRAAMDRFLADYAAGGVGGRYVAAALPALPFAAGAFRLALCSHFLFLYSAHYALGFHLAAARELCRVAAEVRIFPLLDLTGAPSPFVDPVAEALRGDGYAVERVRVPYEFQRGGHTMLRVCSRPPAA